MAKTTRDTAATLLAMVAPVSRWIDSGRDNARLRAKSPDQREDLGLTLGDMARIGY